MLFFVIAVPGRFADCCEALTAALVQQVSGAVELTSGDTLDEIARNALFVGASYSVVASRHPRGRLMRALTEAGRPFVVVLDDLRLALADLVRRQGFGIAAATRDIASSCASALCFSALPGALVLRAERDEGDPLATARAIARHLQLEIGDAEIAAVAGRASAQTNPETVDGDVWWDGLDQAERSIADGALGAYLHHSPGRALGPITWERELFFDGNHPKEGAAVEIDITGRARCLLHGPQILLPPATWSLTASMAISPDAAEHSFVLEATAGAALSRTVIRPPEAGVVEATLSLALAELPDEPIELRLYNERPAFGGHVSLLRVTAVPQPGAASEAAFAAGDLPSTGGGA